MSAKHPRRLRIVVSTVAALAFGLLLLKWRDNPHRLDETKMTAAMKSLWVDDYPAVGDGVPPWPRGISAEQSAILSRTQSVVVATIDPYPTDGPSFHGHQVLGARRYPEPERAREVVARIVDSFHHEGWAADEFYPQFAARVTAQDDRGDAAVVDFLIAPHYRGMYVLTPAEKRFCVIDERARPSVYSLFEGLPRKYEFE